MESLSLTLSPLSLLTLLLAACLLGTLAAKYYWTADEEQCHKSCEAKTSEQAQSHLAQMKAVQDERDSEKRVNDSLRHERSAREGIHQLTITERGRYQRDSEFLRRQNATLRARLREAEKSTATIESAHRITEQWDSVRDTLAAAGFVAATPEDLGLAIEKLLKLRDSAEAPSNQAALDKKQLASERAAKEAALKEVAKLQTKARTLESSNKDLRAAAKAKSEPKNHSHEELDNRATAKLQKQLKNAQEATTDAESKLRKAKDTIRHKDGEIATLNKQKDAEIASLRADIKKIEMNGATTSASLQQELSETTTELADAKKTIDYFMTEGQELWERNKFLMSQGQVLVEMYNELNADSHAVKLSDLAGRDQKISQLSSDLAGRDQKINELSSDLAARDQKISALTNDLEWEKLLNTWTPDDPIPALPNNDNVSNMVDGTDYTFPDDFFNDSLNNNGSIGNTTDLDALMSNAGFNNRDSGSIADLGALNDLGGSSINGGLQYQQNGDQGLLNALDDSSGMNTHGGFLPEQNGDLDMVNALNGSSTLNTDGGFLSEQNGDHDMLNALDGSSGMNTHGGFLSEQNVW